MDCRVLKNNHGVITNDYQSNHEGVDLVGVNHTLDKIIAHSDGVVIFCQDGLNNLPGSTGNTSYGNCIKIDHGNNYQTLYAHMKPGLAVKNGDAVFKGQYLGDMGDSGNAYGSHLHFEVWSNGERINPNPYLNDDFPNNQKNNYNLGTIVNINGVYVSSTSDEKLTPLITKGTITKIVNNAKNPYLLDDGLIGWIRDENIISIETSNTYLSNNTYTGVSIVDALKEINVDSSYKYRSYLAKKNGINNYQGTSEENLTLLNLLKKGKLLV